MMLAHEEFGGFLPVDGVLPAMLDETTWVTVDFGTAFATVQLLVLAALGVIILANSAC